jgi:hypothetical protein
MEAGMKPRVYTASKLAQAPRWRLLKAERPDVTFTARWISYAGWPTDDPRHIADTPENAVRFWVEDEEDVLRADVVLCYAEGDEHLRGGLVEAGIGLGARKHVIVVGEHRDYGTWQYHPRVHRVETIHEALSLAHALVGPAELMAAWRAGRGEASA